MEMGFLRSAERMLADRIAPRLDYGVLVATLSSVQGAHAGCSVSRSTVRQGDGETGVHAPLVELLAGGPAWREAVIRQAGRFNRGITVAQDKMA